MVYFVVPESVHSLCVKVILWLIGTRELYAALGYDVYPEIIYFLKKTFNNILSFGPKTYLMVSFLNVLRLKISENY